MNLFLREEGSGSKHRQAIDARKMAVVQSEKRQIVFKANRANQHIFDRAGNSRRARFTSFEEGDEDACV